VQRGFIVDRCTHELCTCRRAGHSRCPETTPRRADPPPHLPHPQDRGVQRGMKEIKQAWRSSNRRGGVQTGVEEFKQAWRSSNRRGGVQTGVEAFKQAWRCSNRRGGVQKGMDNFKEAWRSSKRRVGRGLRQTRDVGAVRRVGGVAMNVVSHDALIRLSHDPGHPTHGLRQPMQGSTTTASQQTKVDVILDDNF
jgi:hypothetical protein